MADPVQRPARYLSVAGIAVELGIKPATLTQKAWRHHGTHPVPAHDAEISHGYGPDKGWLPSSLPAWRAWLESLPGQGAGGGRPRKSSAPE
jgi:hypothetical protein